MKLNCPKCQNHIAADQMNLERMVAKCNRCDNLFSFADRFPTSASQSPLMPPPPKVTVDQYGTDLIIEWSWFENLYIWLLIFTIFWDIIVFGFLGAGLMTVINGDLTGLFYCFIPHVWVGVGLTYYVACGFINKTTVTTTNSKVIIKHGPLPFWGNKEIDISSIKQLYTKHASIWGKSFSNSRNSYFYLYGIKQDNQEIKILSGLETAEIPLFVEQQIERHLNIEDIPVPGEYGRR